MINCEKCRRKIICNKYLTVEKRHVRSVNDFGAFMECPIFVYDARIDGIRAAKTYLKSKWSKFKYNRFIKKWEVEHASSGIKT